MSPEELINNNYDGLKSDVYAFRILMYEIIYDSYPYPDYKNETKQRRLHIQLMLDLFQWEMDSSQKLIV